VTLTERIEGELTKAIAAIRGSEVTDERIAKVFAIALVEILKSYEARCAGWGMDQTDRCRQLTTTKEGTAQCSRPFGHDDALECRYKPEEIADDGRVKR
jgi:hypothetical protein